MVFPTGPKRRDRNDGIETTGPQRLMATRDTERAH